MADTVDEPEQLSLPPTRPRLLTDVRLTLRRMHYSYRTEQSYVHWMKRFIYFHGKKHPKEMGAAEVTAFLNHLATERNVAAATQNQALNALLFLYKEILHVNLPWLNDVVRAKRPARLPTVLTQDEVKRLIAGLEGTKWLLVSILYGGGLRQRECLQLRVKDMDVTRRLIIVRAGKGNRDRSTVLPERLIEPVKAHLDRLKAFHQADLKAGYGEVPLPFSLSRKYPRAGYEFGWQFVFPSATRCQDPYTGRTVRFHVHPSTIQRAVKVAARNAQIVRPVSCHTFRHSFATHLLENGYNIREVQEILGHKNVQTTMLYTHVMAKGAKGLKSPFDAWTEPSVTTAN
jgi:integron integrase